MQRAGKLLVASKKSKKERWQEDFLDRCRFPVTRISRSRKIEERSRKTEERSRKIEERSRKIEEIVFCLNELVLGSFRDTGFFWGNFWADGLCGWIAFFGGQASLVGAEPPNTPPVKFTKSFLHLIFVSA